MESFTLPRDSDFGVNESVDPEQLRILKDLSVAARPSRSSTGYGDPCLPNTSDISESELQKMRKDDPGWFKRLEKTLRSSNSPILERTLSLSKGDWKPEKTVSLSIEDTIDDSSRRQIFKKRKLYSVSDAFGDALESDVSVPEGPSSSSVKNFSDSPRKFTRASERLRLSVVKASPEEELRGSPRQSFAVWGRRQRQRQRQRQKYSGRFSQVLDELRSSIGNSNIEDDENEDVSSQNTATCRSHSSTTEFQSASEQRSPQVSPSPQRQRSKSWKQSRSGQPVEIQDVDSPREKMPVPNCGGPQKVLAPIEETSPVLSPSPKERHTKAWKKKSRSGRPVEIENADSRNEAVPQNNTGQQGQENLSPDGQLSPQKHPKSGKKSQSSRHAEIGGVPSSKFDSATPPPQIEKSLELSGDSMGLSFRAARSKAFAVPRNKMRVSRAFADALSKQDSEDMYGEATMASLRESSKGGSDVASSSRMSPMGRGPVETENRSTRTAKEDEASLAISPAAGKHKRTWALKKKTKAAAQFDDALGSDESSSENDPDPARDDHLKRKTSDVETEASTSLALPKQVHPNSSSLNTPINSPTTTSKVFRSPASTVTRSSKSSSLRVLTSTPTPVRTKIHVPSALSTIRKKPSQHLSASEPSLPFETSSPPSGRSDTEAFPPSHRKGSSSRAPENRPSTRSGGTSLRQATSRERISRIASPSPDRKDQTDEEPKGEDVSAQTVSKRKSSSPNRTQPKKVSFSTKERSSALSQTRTSPEEEMQSSSCPSTELADNFPIQTTSKPTRHDYIHESQVGRSPTDASDQNGATAGISKYMSENDSSPPSPRVATSKLSLGQGSEGRRSILRFQEALDTSDNSSGEETPQSRSPPRNASKHSLHMETHTSNNTSTAVGRPLRSSVNDLRRSIRSVKNSSKRSFSSPKSGGASSLVSNREPSSPETRGSASKANHETELLRQSSARRSLRQSKQRRKISLSDEGKGLSSASLSVDASMGLMGMSSTKHNQLSTDTGSTIRMDSAGTKEDISTFPMGMKTTATSFRTDSNTGTESAGTKRGSSFPTPEKETPSSPPSQGFIQGSQVVGSPTDASGQNGATAGISKYFSENDSSSPSSRAATSKLSLGQDSEGRRSILRFQELLYTSDNSSGEESSHSRSPAGNASIHSSPVKILTSNNSSTAVGRLPSPSVNDVHSSIPSVKSSSKRSFSSPKSGGASSLVSNREPSSPETRGSASKANHETELLRQSSARRSLRQSKKPQKIDISGEGKGLSSASLSVNASMGLMGMSSRSDNSLSSNTGSTIPMDSAGTKEDISTFATGKKISAASFGRYSNTGTESAGTKRGSSFLTPEKKMPARLTGTDSDSNIQTESGTKKCSSSVSPGKVTPSRLTGPDSDSNIRTESAGTKKGSVSPAPVQKPSARSKDASLRQATLRQAFATSRIAPLSPDRKVEGDLSNRSRLSGKATSKIDQSRSPSISGLPLTSRTSSPSVMVGAYEGTDSGLSADERSDSVRIVAGAQRTDDYHSISGKTELTLGQGKFEPSCVSFNPERALSPLSETHQIQRSRSQMPEVESRAADIRRFLLRKPHGSEVHKSTRKTYPTIDRQTDPSREDGENKFDQAAVLARMLQKSKETRHAAQKEPEKTTERVNTFSQKTRRQSGNPPAAQKKKFQLILRDGKVYECPKLIKPKKFVTEKMYRFLMKKLEPKYHLSSRVKAEDFVVDLCDTYTKVLRRKKHKPLIVLLMKSMIRLGLVSTYSEFYRFIEDFMPMDFRRKSIPCYGSDLAPEQTHDLYEKIVL